MGIEYIIVNLDRKELLDFDRLGFGTKIGATTSGLIPSFLSWLLVNPTGYGNDVPKMLGRWAGDRIEIIGDEGIGVERQAHARSDFQDITVDVVQGFAEGDPFERITQMQPMGLIDREGKVVIDPKDREAVAEYWEQVAEKEAKEWQLHVDNLAKIEKTLRSGSAAEVLALRCPVGGGQLRIGYVNVPGGNPRFFISNMSEFAQWLPAPAVEPAWVSVLGCEFETQPGKAEQESARPNDDSAIAPPS